MKILSMFILVLVLIATAATAQAPTVSIGSAINLGSNYGWVSGSVAPNCDLSWTTNAGAYGYVGPTSGAFGVYVYPLAPGTNRVTVQCDNADGSGYDRKSIEN